MDLLIVCSDSDIDITSEYASCQNWITVDYAEISQQSDLEQLSDLLVNFDGEIFAIILAANVVAFAIGNIVGMLVRIMNRT